MNWRLWKRKDADIPRALKELARSKKAIARTSDLERQAEKLQVAHKDLCQSNGFYEKVVNLFGDVK